MELEDLTTDYVALTWREKNFEIYKADKYHVKEDRLLFDTMEDK